MFIFSSRVVLGKPTNIMKTIVINIGIINKKMENHSLVNIETLQEKTGELIYFQLWFLLQLTEGKISKQICGTMTNIFWDQGNLSLKHLTEQVVLLMETRDKMKKKKD